MKGTSGSAFREDFKSFDEKVNQAGAIEFSQMSVILAGNNTLLGGISLNQYARGLFSLIEARITVADGKRPDHEYIILFDASYPFVLVESVLSAFHLISDGADIVFFGREVEGYPSISEYNSEGNDPFFDDDSFDDETGEKNTESLQHYVSGIAPHCSICRNMAVIEKGYFNRKFPEYNIAKNLNSEEVFEDIFDRLDGADAVSIVLLDSIQSFSVNNTSDARLATALLSLPENSAYRVNAESAINADRIAMLVCDVDGVLTDAGMYYMQSGDEMKKFHSRDGMGIMQLRKKGFPVGLISTGVNEHLIRSRARTIGIESVATGKFDKLETLDNWRQEFGLEWEQIAYIGDDINDRTVGEKVGLLACPADAHPSIISISQVILSKKGGDACVREFIDLFLYDRIVKESIH